MTIDNILCQSRMRVGFSQEYMANKIGVHRRTVSNWEKGVSIPNINETIQWFSILGLNPEIQLYKYLHQEFITETNNSNEKEINRILTNIIYSLPLNIKKMLIYIFSGEHGSSSYALINMLVAHIQCGLFVRVNHSLSILNDYIMYKKIGKLNNPDEIQPDEKMLGKAIKAGISSVYSNREEYNIFDKVDEYTI